MTTREAIHETKALCEELGLQFRQLHSSAIGEFAEVLLGNKRLFMDMYSPENHLLSKLDGYAEGFRQGKKVVLLARRQNCCQKGKPNGD